MKKITYFFRPQGFSIERVFETIISGINVDSYNIKRTFIKVYKFWPIGMFLNMIYCSRNRSKDINHITGDIHYCALLLPNKNTILTIHDSVSLDFNDVSIYVRNFVRLFWYYLPLKKLNYITCISNKTRDTLINAFPWSQRKIRVIYNPIHPDYKFVEKEFNIESPVILHIGTNANKNLERVIEALKEIPCHLRIIGKITEKQIELLSLFFIDYSVVQNLTDKEIIDEYINCDIVSFPSLYEGFGMPIVEGQETGRVLLISNIEPMTEIAGNGACFVDPYDVTSISDGFKQVISNVKFREELVSNGRINVERFSVSSIAKQYEELYNEILQSQNKTLIQ